MIQKHLETLEFRTLLDATLNNGLLTVTGSDNAETILISQQDGTQIIVDIGGVQTPFEAALVNTISISALAGDDTITVDVNRPTTILGGAGIDNIIGSDGGADNVTGQQGNDTFTGRGGDDTFIWNPGDGNDVIDGDAGNDTHIFNGSAGNEVMSATPNGQRVTFVRDIANITMDIGGFENLTVNALGGNDSVSGAVGLATLLTGLVTFNGDAGNDSLNGGDGNDRLNGGADNDAIDGNRGADTAFMGDGDDVFTWDPGDGSDVVEGEEGTDELQFNGSGGDEIFEASPLPGNRVKFFRNLGNINMDLNSVERLDVAALGGADFVSLRDTAGTGLTEINVELEGTVGSGTPDGSPDSVSVFGSSGADNIIITGDASGGVAINGTSATVTILHPDPLDTLKVDGRGGSDTLDASALEADAGLLTLAGNTGHDSLLGGAGIDTFFGAAGNDFVDGNRGNDIANLDAGNDIFQWDPGDGSDVIEGGADFDTLLFNGSGGAEIMEASANGARMRFTRDVGNITMDAGDTEKLDVRAQGGNDTITVGDMSPTPTNTFFIDAGDGDDTLTGGPARETLIGGLGTDSIRGNGGNDFITGNPLNSDDALGDKILAGTGNDTALFGNGDRFDMGTGTDELIYRGTDGDDVITVDSRVTANLQRALFVTNLGNKQATFLNGEQITVDARGGDDTVVMSQSASSVWKARFFGGDGNDLLIGGNLADILQGNAGDDTLIGRGGTDALDGGDGTNDVTQ